MTDGQSSTRSGPVHKPREFGACDGTGGDPWVDGAGNWHCPRCGGLLVWSTIAQCHRGRGCDYGETEYFESRYGERYTGELEGDT